MDDSSICLISAGRRLGRMSIVNGLHIFLNIKYTLLLSNFSDFDTINVPYWTNTLSLNIQSKATIFYMQIGHGKLFNWPNKAIEHFEWNALCFFDLNNGTKCNTTMKIDSMAYIINQNDPSHYKHNMLYGICVIMNALNASPCTLYLFEITKMHCIERERERERARKIRFRMKWFGIENQVPIQYYMWETVYPVKCMLVTRNSHVAWKR